MSKNRYIFDTVLDGFVNVYKPSGKYNNCCFSMTLPKDVIKQADSDREELLEWAKTKVSDPKRVALNPPKWDDDGLVKYSYEGDTGRPAPVFVDTTGNPIEEAVLKDLRKGTKVRVIAQQKPYTKPAMGTTLKVLGVQVVELATGNGAVDSGDLSAEDVASMFGTVDCYKQGEPMVRKAEAVVGDGESYDF